MEQKQRFVCLAGSGHFTMTELCRDFGVSRKTGHKWVARHAEGGMKALEERSRAPKSVTCRTSDEVERLICSEKRLRSTWGPKKIRQILLTKHGLESPPAISTVSEVLKRHGLVAERRRRGAVFKVERGRLTVAERPNHVLGVDFKGWFLTGDGRRCDPLTVTDLHSRFILKIEGLEEARTSFAKGVPGVVPPPGLAGDHPGGQRGAVRVAGAGGLEQAERLVDRVRHRGPVLAARLPAGQRLPRADAPHDEGGMLPAAERERAGAATAFRPLAQGLQRGASA